MNWLRFGHPEFLYFLCAIPPVILLILFGLRQKRKAILRFHTQANPTHFRNHTVQAGLLMLSYVLVTLAIARPQFGAKPEPVAERLEVMLALDISTSMLATDIKPNRLHHAKSVIFSLLARLEGNRIGLLHFAEASFVVCPLTTDTSMLKEFLDAVEAETLTHSGTRIGNAIEIANARLDSEKQTDAASNHQAATQVSALSGQKALILFTDGEDHGEEAVEAAKAAHREGVYIYCIGVGTPEQPVPIPLAGPPALSLGSEDNKGKDSPGLFGYKRDVSGQLVLTALDEALLRDIAKAGGGTYYHASTDMARLTADLARLQRQKFRVSSKGEYQERFQLLVGIALILLVCELLFSSIGFLLRFFRCLLFSPRNRAGGKQSGEEAAQNRVS